MITFANVNYDESNFFVGTIPFSFGSLAFLKNLDLSINCIFGIQNIEDFKIILSQKNLYLLM